MNNAATMDFFAHQDRARRHTSLLVGYYVLAVVLIVLGVYAAFAAVFLGAGMKAGAGLDWSRAWEPRLFASVIGATVLIVLGGTLYKILQLSRGGEAVARMLGGRPVSPDTADADERKLLNVVEEMAIASGTPVPRVFLLEHEQGINAFAAGFEPANAVIGVTHGCIRTLTRDELQGVIAHEFSHILNGDMRLNIRLVGILNGILVIALIGYGLMRAVASGSRTRTRSRNSKGGGGVAGIFLLGLLLMAIGYIGVFFGKLIKSAVSRQREFLADASAVQFTRNPDGIAGALKKIGGYKQGSRLRTSHAEETSHFFFSNGLRSSLLGLMATHPPLGERIRRIEPSFAGARGGAAKASPPPAAAPAAAGVSGFAVEPGEVAASVGAPQREHLAYAAGLLGSLPDALRAAVRDAFGARAVIYGLLLSEEANVRARQLETLAAGERAVHDKTLELAPLLAQAGARVRLPLADLALAALRDLSPEQFRAFRDTVSDLVRADESIDLFEYTLQRMLFRHLAPAMGAPAPRAASRTRQETKAASIDLLACLAYWGADSTEEAQRAFTQGCRRAALEGAALPPVDVCGLQKVDEALDRLAQAAPSAKRDLIEACSACVGSDGWVTVEEAELLRAVADSLGCPIPPFLPGRVEAGAA